MRRNNNSLLPLLPLQPLLPLLPLLPPLPTRLTPPTSPAAPTPPLSPEGAPSPPTPPTPPAPPTPNPQPPINTQQPLNPTEEPTITQRRKPGGFRWITLLAGAVVIGVLAIDVMPRIHPKAELVESDRIIPAVPTVNVVRPKLASNRAELSLPGSIQAVKETTIYARTNGYLRQGFVDVGTRVRAGQVLAEIDTPEADRDVEQARAEVARSEANLTQAKADLAQKQTNLTQAKANLEARRAELLHARTNLELTRQTWQRWQQLHTQGVVSQQDADERTTALSATQANVKAVEAIVNTEQNNVNSAQANINSLQANVNAFAASVAASRAHLQRNVVLQSFKKVTAPFDGVITARNVDTGALINTGSNNSNGANAGLFKLAQTDNLRIRIKVPQTFIKSIQQGQTAQISVRELPKRTFTGRVIHTADALDPSSKTLLTEVQLPNPDNVLRPGMYAQVKFTTNRENPSLLVPANTLVTNSQGTQVATVTLDQTVQYRKVEIGRNDGTQVEITNGLSLNESLITNPTNDLREGSRVKTVAAKLKKKD